MPAAAASSSCRFLGRSFADVRARPAASGEAGGRQIFDHEIFRALEGPGRTGKRGGGRWMILLTAGPRQGAG